MRNIKYIVLHCTATQQNASVESIKNYWKNHLGWKSPGYHFLIKPSGEAESLISIEHPSNGVAGYNQASIHISYIGGIDANGKPVDNRTPAQIEKQIELLQMLTKQFPKAEIKGHRDFPGVKKSCPSFDVKKWLQTIKLNKMAKVDVTIDQVEDLGNNQYRITITAPAPIQEGQIEEGERLTIELPSKPQPG